MRSLVSRLQGLRIVLLGLGCLVCLSFWSDVLSPVFGQSFDAQGLNNQIIEKVDIRIANPTGDAAYNGQIVDQVRRALRLFPGTRYSDERISLSLGSVYRNPAIARVDYEPLPLTSGGVELTLTVTLGQGAATVAGRGFMLTKKPSDFPLAYEKNGTVLKFKLETLTLFYGNNNAWYGQPGPMLAGNPLVQGKPAGAGWTDWFETYIHYGVYGLTPVNPNLSFYGGLSAITTGSIGQELFTNQIRSFTHVEDAYLGFVGGNVDAKGNRLTFNFSAGRQRFTLSNGFLIANTAANGYNRAALQANARWLPTFWCSGRSPTTTCGPRCSTSSPTS